MSIGNISSLPISIQTDRRILENGEKIEKFPVGPTSAKPGPTFEIHVVTLVNVVMRSKPSTAPIITQVADKIII